MPLKVFISYKFQDTSRNTWVDQLYRDLREVGIDAKLYNYEIELGESFSEYMTRGIRECDYLLFVITPEAVKAIESGNGALAFEMEIANARRIKEGFRIIPIFREGIETSTYLSDHRYLDFRNDDNYDDSFAELIQWLFRKIKPPPLGDLSFESERDAINHARELVKIARKEFEDKNYLEAQKKLEIAIHLDPDDISSLGLYGRTLTNLGKFEKAIVPLTKGIELTQFPSNRKIYLTSRMISNYFMGKYDLTIEDGNKIIEISPKHRQGHRLRAIAWIALKCFDQAIADINFSLEEKNDYLCGHAIKAIILKKINDVTNAIKEIDICATLQAKDGVDFYCLSLAYANIGNSEKAIEMLIKSIQNDSKCLPRAKVEPLFGEIRDNPRFEIAFSTLSSSLEQADNLEE